MLGPKPWIVLGSLLGGVGVLFLLNPPHTPCQSQLDNYKLRHTPFFLLDTQAKYKTTTGFEKIHSLMSPNKLTRGLLRAF